MELSPHNQLGGDALAQEYVAVLIKRGQVLNLLAVADSEKSFLRPLNIEYTVNISSMFVMSYVNAPIVT